MIVWSWARVLVFAISLLAVASSGCSDNAEVERPDGGIDGGVTTALSALSGCAGDGLRGFMGFLEILEPLLRHADDAPDHKMFPVPAGVTYHSESYEFAWSIDVDGVGGAETLVSGQLVESTGGNPANLANGIQSSEVVLVPWDWVANAETTAASKFSVVGLDQDSVRMTIVEETWYDDGVSCHFEITSFAEHLDLADPGSERFAFVLGGWVESGVHTLENAWVTLGGEHGHAEW